MEPYVVLRPNQALHAAAKAATLTGRVAERKTRNRFAASIADRLRFPLGVVRGTLKAIFWLAPPFFPYIVTESVEDATVLAARAPRARYKSGGLRVTGAASLRRST